MNVKDELDKMAHNIADALKAFHERLARIEAWMIEKENNTTKPETEHET